MNFISNIISENLINAIGWTIIHSLWQGAAAALGFGLVMFFLRRANARTRYLVGVMALILILAMSVVTFVGIYQPGMPGMPATGGKGSELALTDAAAIEGNTILAVFFTNYFNRHLPLVVTIWLLGVLVLVLRLAGGFLYNQRLKIHRNQPLPTSWQSRLETFCRQTGIRKPIGLVESALVKVPMTIGHFKPVILFPLGLVTGLPRDQVEALLAHELGHILRKDYLVNILQSFVDILFFYHPGVRWISSQTRAERENCCDDIAVSLSGDSLHVARALTNIQGYGTRTPYPAMAASGRKSGSHGLLARIKRLVSPPVKGSGFAAGTGGAVVLVVGLLILLVSTHAAAALNQDTANDKSPAVKSVQSADEDQDQEKVSEKKKKEEKLEILEKKLREQEAKLRELEVLMRKQEARMRVQEKEMREHEKKMRMQEAEMRKQEAKMRGQVETGMRKQEEALRDQEKMMREEGALLRKQEAEMRKQEALLRKQEAEMRKQEALMRAQEAEMRKYEAAARAMEKELQKQQDYFMKILVKELMQDKLISDKEDFEFQFKYGKLYINGKKQSNELYKKYKNLYEKATGKTLNENSNFRIINRK